MAAQKFLNNFTSAFTIAVATGDTVLRLPSSATALLGSLTGGDWYILTAFKMTGSVESAIEVVKVTNVDPNGGNDCLLTVVRAQEGTTASAYLIGDFISMRITAGGLNALSSDAELSTHTSNASNPHSVTKTQVGLGLADNTSDADKPVSTAQLTALNAKQATLVSGTNVKTVNGNSLLGSGDLVVSGALIVEIVTGTTHTAVPGKHYVFTNVAASTLTLPTTFAVTDAPIAVSQINGLKTNAVNAGSSTVFGPTGPMTGTITMDLGATMTFIPISTTAWVSP